jgi:hypothetical protein
MRLRFTIRDLLWLTVVVALAIGWWLDHRKLAPLDVTKLSFQQLEDHRWNRLTEMTPQTPATPPPTSR